jgi:hypothetical protein
MLTHYSRRRLAVFLPRTSCRVAFSRLPPLPSPPLFPLCSIAAESARAVAATRMGAANKIKHTLSGVCVLEQSSRARACDIAWSQLLRAQLLLIHVGKVEGELRCGGLQRDECDALGTEGRQTTAQILPH